MRKIFVCTLVLVAASVQLLSAQNKGDKYFGGIVGVNVSATSVEGVSTTSASVGANMEFGFFAADRFKIGINAAYEVNVTGDPVHALTVGPEFSYYVRLCDKFYYVPSFEVAFAYSRSYSENMFGFGVGLSLLGFEFRPTQHFGISVDMLSFNYVYLTYKSLSAHNITGSLGFSPTVGLKYYF